jgi:HK97 family phage prohead protease
MTEQIEYKTIRTELKADETGKVSAVIATFGVIDRDFDIIEPGTFTPGQKVPMAWAHDWSRPVGKGLIEVTNSAAIFDGSFFMETQAGLEAYKTVKAMDDLQDWSWGYRVLDATPEMRDGEMIRIIKKAEVYEVSPVLVGAGVGTFTLDLKNLTFDDHEKTALDAVRSYGERLRSVAGLREKQRRQMGEKRLAGLRAVLLELQAVEKTLESMAQPDVDVRQLYNQYLQIEARLNGAQEE